MVRPNMSRKHSERMYRVSRFMEREQEKASRRITQLRDALEDTEQQLRTLRDYMQGYNADCPNGTSGGNGLADPYQLRNYSVFLGQLNRAVREQEMRVARARQAYDEQLQHWKTAQSRTLAVERVAERRAEDEQRRAERSEQELADERILRRYFGQAV